MRAGQYDKGIEITCLVQVGRSGIHLKLPEIYQKKWKKRLTPTLKSGIIYTY